MSAESAKIGTPAFFLHLRLPEPPHPSDVLQVASFWRDMVATAQQITRGVILGALHDLRSRGLLKAYKETDSICWAAHHHRMYPERLSGKKPDELGLLELSQPGSATLACHSFRVVFSKDLALCFSLRHDPSTNYRPTFLAANHPWEGIITWLRYKELKTQKNLEFGIHVLIHFPIAWRTALPTVDHCPHEFRVLKLGVYEWRLVWECRHCGYICHCSCFRRAIEADPFPSHWLRRYEQEIGRRLDRIPFFDRACEMCREVPVTAEFCSPMYVRSNFEAHYAAYIMKRMAEMRADGLQVPYAPLLDPRASDYIREQLGHHKIGERWVEETKLFQIIRDLFLNEKVIHHYRAKWLGRYELDIYVPNRQLAIEFHGPQHFQPIEAWGGEEGLKRTQDRDAEKARLCQQQGAQLVVFTSQDEISPHSVASKLAATAKGLGRPTDIP